MKIPIAILAFSTLSSAGLYGTGVIGGDAYESMFEAELNDDSDAEVTYPMAMEDVFSKLISTPVIEAFNKGGKKGFAPQIVISAKGNRQITWTVNVQNEHVGDVVIDLISADAASTQVKLLVNIADNSILTAADSSSHSDIDKLEKLSRLLIAMVIDQRLSGTLFGPDKIRSAYFTDPNAQYLMVKLAAIESVLSSRSGSPLPELDTLDFNDDDIDDYYEHSPESMTEPTDATIGEVDQSSDWSSGSYEAEREIRNAERAAERASEQAAEAVARASQRAAEAAERAAEAAEGARRRASN
jgi:hypothetical protein